MNESPIRAREVADYPQVALNNFYGLPLSTYVRIMRKNRFSFSPKRISKSVKAVLESAIANAENNHDLDVDELIVSEAYVGKNLVMKRWKPRARGRVGRIQKPFSQITIVVREKSAETSGEAA